MKKLIPYNLEDFVSLINETTIKAKLCTSRFSFLYLNGENDTEHDKVFLIKYPCGKDDSKILKLYLGGAIFCRAEGQDDTGLWIYGEETKNLLKREFNKLFSEGKKVVGCTALMHLNCKNVN